MRALEGKREKGFVKLKKKNEWEEDGVERRPYLWRTENADDGVMMQ